MKRRVVVPFIAWAVVLFVCQGAAFGQPLGVSPGGVGTSPACPTFSWGLVEGSVSYQLAVYESPGGSLASLEDVDAVTGGPVLSHTIPAPALSWTPSSGQCLAEGNYLWYVRGVDGEGNGTWSPGTAFAVRAMLTEAEFEERVAGAVEKYLTRHSLAAAGGMGGKSLYEIVNTAGGVTQDGMSKTTGPSLLPKSATTLNAPATGTNGASIYLDGNVSLANGSGRVGIGTDNMLAGLHVISNEGVLFEGSVGGAIPTEGGGTRMMWYPGKSAFRAGTCGPNDWIDGNIGPDSVAMGNSTRATAPYSFAMGNQSVASAYGAAAIGTLAEASGAHSIALGRNAKAQSYGETAMGYYSTLATNPTPGSPVATDRLLVIGNGDSGTPSDALVILKNGDTTINGPESNGTASSGTLKVSTSNGQTIVIDGNEIDQANGNTLHINYNKPGDVSLASGGGRVGIGASAPATKLDVNGVIRAYGSTTPTTGTGLELGYDSATNRGFLQAYNRNASLQGDLLLGNGLVSIGTAFPDAGLHVASNRGVLFEDGPGDSVIPREDVGTRMMWYQGKGAFRAGSVSGTQWNDAKTGDNSVAMGLNTEASGAHSFAVGMQTTASAPNSAAFGDSTTASGSYSTAMGQLTEASGTGSTVMGNNTKAQAYLETAIGYFNTLAASPNPSAWVATDRLFVIGNGWGGAHDAMVVLKNGNVGIGSSTPVATLDIMGYARLAKYSSEPVACDNTTRGSIALNSTYKLCVCGAMWVYVDGGLPCAWQ